MNEQGLTDLRELGIHQLSANFGSNQQDLSGAMEDRDGWQESVNQIHDNSAI